VISDKRTGELLRRLNMTDSPMFYDYGTSPPRHVLDLGCGQGLVSLSLLHCDLPNRGQTLGR
jgi:methylase of polypeptide subunit release factors